MLNRSSGSAIASMSRLAEVYYSDRRTLTATQIAESRKLQQPFVAKLLTTLSQAGLIRGVRGPGGGYSLARPPAQITLLDIAGCFERDKTVVTCPFGPGWCGDGPRCPLHDDVIALQEHVRVFLAKTTLSTFSEPQPAAAANG